ncbi:MAG: hypothetical protein GXO81_02675, partial [Chlorobi bacterium]|nr:hypothetical protein [Chlorobiota bacterium]
MQINFWRLFLLTLILNQAKGQEYSKVVEPNLTTWYFAHQQLAGKSIDTIFAGGQIDGWIDLWYHGVFMNHEKTYMGKIKCSPNND